MSNVKWCCGNLAVQISTSATPRPTSVPSAASTCPALSAAFAPWVTRWLPTNSTVKVRPCCIFQLLISEVNCWYLQLYCQLFLTAWLTTTKGWQTHVASEMGKWGGGEGENMHAFSEDQPWKNRGAHSSTSCPSTRCWRSWCQPGWVTDVRCPRNQTPASKEYEPWNNIPNRKLTTDVLTTCTVAPTCAETLLVSKLQWAGTSHLNSTVHTDSVNIFRTLILASQGHWTAVQSPPIANMPWPWMRQSTQQIQMKLFVNEQWSFNGSTSVMRWWWRRHVCPQ